MNFDLNYNKQILAIEIEDLKTEDLEIEGLYIEDLEIKALEIEVLKLEILKTKESSVLPSNILVNMFPSGYSFVDVIMLLGHELGINFAVCA